MYSDNEKDILGNLNGSQDDAVSWDTIIDTDDDGIVSIKDDSVSNTSSSGFDTEVFANDSVSASDYNELKGIVGNLDDNSYSNVDDVDEEELKRILSEDSSGSGFEPENNSYTNVEVDNSVAENDNTQEEFAPRREEVSKQKSSSPLVFLFLLALLIAGGSYFILSNSSKDEADVPQVMNTEDVPNAADDSPKPEENNQEGQIPVVNEDETAALKPNEAEEENKNDKKEVVNVVPTGRPNPFMPLSKYVVKNETKIINNIDYDSVSIPKPPTEYGKISEYTEKLMTIAVSGIMYDKSKPSAIITYENNDYFVQIGDKLDRFQVVDIAPSYVQIALGKNVYKANIGEEFKIKEFFGNVPFKNGARQYYSTEDEYKNSRDGINGYTSDSDVTIRTR